MEKLSNEPDTPPRNLVIRLEITASKLVLAATVFLIGSLLAVALVKTVGADLNSPALTKNSQDFIYPTALSAAFSRAAQNVEDSVVYITTLDLDSEGDAYSQNSGTGIIVDPAGYILTNAHVIGNANRIKVRTSDGATLSATLIGTDEETDLAVVKVTTSKLLKPANVGDSEKVMVGEWVLAVGSPFGLQQTVTAGIISAKERVTDSRRSFQQMLQTDAAINPGNSGGPLVNMSGEVVGINTQIATRTGSFQGIGFAVPSLIFTDVYNQLVKQGRVSRGYLGIYPDKLTPQFCQVFGLPSQEGALVQDVTDIDGPAAKGGLRTGDVIVEFDGYKIKDDRDLIRRIVLTPINSPVKVRFIRAGVETSTNVTLVEREPTPVAKAPRSIPKLDRPRVERRSEKSEGGLSLAAAESKLGFSLSELTEARAQTLGYKGSTDGIFVRKVENNSAAYDAGLRDADIIKQINKKEVRTEADIVSAFKSLKPGDSVVFFIEKRSRNSSRRYFSLTIP
ncbi:MAG: trypsin-like peptidase domain-containing protein [Blastocatellia bacterium]|nr:trypsin-like peptidase domain-containing protein [Blastocatellia bacterium]